MIDTGAAILTAIVLAILASLFVWYQTEELTSNWWKTEIIRRGYGSWETTPDGQVWFKWKEGVK